MAKTNLTILFGRNALNIAADVTVTLNAGGEQPLALASDLQNQNSEKAYATYEPDYWLLDGSYKFIAESASVGYISTEQSGAAGAFTTAPVLQFDFGEVYSTDGLTLHFSELTGDWADDIDVAFYDSGLSLIQTNNYTPASALFSTGQAIDDFQRIIITFNSTNKPYRFARLFNIDFDNVTRWSGGNIKNGKLIEEVDPLSLRMTSNQLEFSLFSDDGDFSITNPQSEYASLQENEPIEAYEQIGDEDIFLGRFYLDEWESVSENEAQFTALDGFALLDKIPHYNPFYSVYSIDYSEDILDHIFATAGLIYEMEASLEGIDVTSSASVPIMSCREALQNVLVYIGGVASCARSRVVNITPLVLASDLASVFDLTLTASEKGHLSSVKLKKAVTSVTVLSHAFIEYTQSATVYSKSLAIGEYLITWDHFALVSFSGTSTRTIIEHGPDYVKVNITGAGTFTVTEAYNYKDQRLPETLENGTLSASTPRYEIHVDDALMVDSTVVGDVTQRIYDYYLQRYIQKTKLFGLTVKAGDTVLIDTQSSQQIKGIVERAEFNLTGGFVSEIEIVGVIA